MKINVVKVFAQSIFLFAILVLPGCKKDATLIKASGQDDKNSATLATNASAVTNVVSTVAGVPNQAGFADGPAKTALFSQPSGIQLTKDGTLYIADYNNNAIRKLTADGKVTTLVLKTSPDYTLRNPTSVGVDDAGNVHVLSYLVDQAGLTYIFDKQGNFIAGYDNVYTAFGALTKDPYEDFFWFSVSTNIGKHIANADGSTGKDYISYNKNLLTDDEQGRGQSFTGLFIGRNKVIYFSTGPRIFKYTPSGFTAQLYPDIKPGRISSLILNADSRSMYLAADGKIEKIENGKLTLLAGPNNTTPDGRDGVGLKADVHASSLALGDHENSLYFSDYNTNTIRKITLK